MRQAILCFLLLVLGSRIGYGQEPTKSNATFPRVVATFKLLNQTAPISQTTIYTPKKWGTFRISLIMVLTVKNGRNAEWSGTVRFKNRGGDFAEPSVGVTTTNPGMESASDVVRAKGGAPITFEVIAIGDTSNTKYNVFVVLEKLM